MTHKTIEKIAAELFPEGSINHLRVTKAFTPLQSRIKKLDDALVRQSQQVLDLIAERDSLKTERDTLSVDYAEALQEVDKLKTELKSNPSQEAEWRKDNRVCIICDGGPGNNCNCKCGRENALEEIKDACEILRRSVRQTSAAIDLRKILIEWAEEYAQNWMCRNPKGSDLTNLAAKLKGE